MIDVRCPQCEKLLFRAEGMGSVIETRCPRCSVTVRWPSLGAVVVREPSAEEGSSRRVGPSEKKGK